jgi:hypothetical protein
MEGEAALSREYEFFMYLIGKTFEAIDKPNLFVSLIDIDRYYHFLILYAHVT